MRPSIIVLLNTIASSIADAAIDVHPQPMHGIPRYRNRHVAVKGSQSLRAPAPHATHGLSRETDCR